MSRPLRPPPTATRECVRERERESQESHRRPPLRTTEKKASHQKRPTCHLESVCPRQRGIPSFPPPWVSGHDRLTDEAQGREAQPARHGSPMGPQSALAMYNQGRGATGAARVCRCRFTKFRLDSLKYQHFWLSTGGGGADAPLPQFFVHRHQPETPLPRPPPPPQSRDARRAGCNGIRSRSHALVVGLALSASR